MFVFKKAETDKQAAKVAAVRVLPRLLCAWAWRPRSPPRCATLHPPPHPPALQTYRDVALTGALIFGFFAVLRIAPFAVKLVRGA